MNDIDLRHLRYFIAVAEELNFTRAAHNLGIRQPPLSMQIRQLEEALDARLFRRLSRGVELTEAGEGFLTEAKDIFERLNRAAANARRRSAGQLGHLRIGFAGATYLSPEVIRPVQIYRELKPDVTLLPTQSNTPLLVQALLNNQIDAAFVRPPLEDDERIKLLHLLEEPMVIALSSDHPLAKVKEPLPLEALKDEDMIMFPREIGPGLYDDILEGLRRAGAETSMWQSAPQLTSILPLVAAGFGASLLPWSMSRLKYDGLVYQDVVGPCPKARIALALHTDETSKIVMDFANIAVSKAKLGYKHER